jgi:hypothetical protein
VTISSTLANAAWRVAAAGARRRFGAALRDPAAAQQALLAGYLRDNQDTGIGRRHGFARIARAGSPGAVVDAYRSAVPVTAYDDLDPLVIRIARGERQVLTRDPVLRLAPSSGSTAAAKLLPQTAASQRELNRAVDAWMADLYRRHPALLGGPAYWSITPSIAFDAIAAARLGGADRRGAIPIGFDDDSGYLGGVRQRLVEAILAVPADVRLVADPEAFRYVTLLFLVRSRALRLISVWHPSFLLQLFESLPRWLDRIAEDIRGGTISAPAPLAPDVERRLRRRLAPDHRRAAEIGRMHDAMPRELWPSLTLVSCWGDGAAQPYAQRLAAALPGVAIQPKGLIATEGIVSIPFDGHHPIAATSHFVEFVDRSGRARLVHELEIGGEYDVVLTTGAGLYRYALGDRIRVTGWLHGTPSIIFVGRSDRVSDRFGEKLSDQFVTTVLEELFAASVPPRFAMLTPETAGDGVAYTLLVEPAAALPADLDAALETALRRNPHYAWCVDLGQLRPARVVRVGPQAERAYLDACVARGQRLGDVKPAALQSEGGWEAALGGLAS